MIISRSSRSQDNYEVISITTSDEYWFVPQISAPIPSPGAIRQGGCAGVSYDIGNPEASSFIVFASGAAYELFSIFIRLLLFFSMEGFH